MSSPLCSALWNNPRVSPVSKRKFRSGRSKLLGQMIKKCSPVWKKEACDVFKKFGGKFSPSGRRLSPGVRSKYHKMCSPRKSLSPRRRRASPKRSAKRSAKRHSPKRSPMSRAACVAAGRVYRSASCAKRSVRRRSASPRRRRASPKRSMSRALVVYRRR